MSIFIAKPESEGNRRNAGPTLPGDLCQLNSPRLCAKAKFPKTLKVYTEVTERKHVETKGFIKNEKSLLVRRWDKPQGASEGPFTPARWDVCLRAEDDNIDRSAIKDMTSV